MTDKQIIIDVCPYQGECSVSGCKRNDDGCFVRQLFEERYRVENQIVELNKTIKTKEQECEELKEELEAVYDDCKGCSTCNEALYNANLYAKEYRKLKATLTEIKEIAEDCMKQDICTTCDNSEKCHIEDEEIPTYDVCKLILQKISECEVE